METETENIKNILLVEDDPRDVELTLVALEEHNLANKIAVVDNGEEALDYLYRRGKFKMRAGGNPIVVLLDNKMPKVNGLEVLKTMKADEHLKRIPVVVLTSSREKPDMIEFFEHGVNAYVVKPVDFPDFVEAVKQLGIFWAVINEPPPPTRREESSIQADKAVHYASPARASDNPLKTGKIALAHLTEFPDYYTRLAKLEAEAKTFWDSKIIRKKTIPRSRKRSGNRISVTDSAKS